MAFSSLAGGCLGGRKCNHSVSSCVTVTDRNAFRPTFGTSVLHRENHRRQMHFFKGQCNDNGLEKEYGGSYHEERERS